MKKFWNEVTVEGEPGAFHVALDARPIRTQGGGRQIVPTRAAAELLAGEWRAQGEKVDPRAFTFRDLTDFAIDMVRPDRAATIDKLLDYAGTDTLCYRATPDEPLFARQEELWEPLVAACEARHAMRFERISGIVHQPPADASLAALRVRLEREDDFTLAALLTLASLAASIVVPLAVIDGDGDPAALFAAANVEEDWQAELWGWDHEAQHTRALRLEAFEKAAAFAEAVRG